MNEQGPKKNYCRFKYSEEALSKALEDITNGNENLSSASKKYRIPKSTLHNKITYKTPNIRRMGPKPVLSELEENRIEHWILAKAKLGFPMHPVEVKDAVQKILTETDHPNPFKENRPGEKWLSLFLQRHPKIAKRNTEIISKSRAAVTEEAIREWFSDLKKYLVEHNLLDMMEDSTRIFNADETGVRTCVKSGLVLGPVSKNFRNLYEISSGNEKESITVLCNYSASGEVVPPLVVFPYKRIPKELAMSVPGDWGIGRSDSGWMTSGTFFEYVVNIFYNWLVKSEIKFPIILFIDGHKSHYSIELYDFCVKNKIVLYCLYPNSTHILQPCDVTIFKPLKTEWKKACQAHKQKTSTSITRYNFCPLFKEAFDKASHPATIQNGFKSCGLYPLNADNVDFLKCISTRRKETFSHNEEANTGLTCQDYQSCLKVMSNFLGAAKIEEFKNLTSEVINTESTYALWKYCKTSTNAVDISEKNNVQIEHFSKSFIDNLPLEIDGVLYSSSINNELTSDTGTFFAEPTVIDFNFLNEDINQKENLLMCQQIIDFILESAFDIIHIIEGNKDMKKSTLLDSTKNTKIHVVSNIVIKQKKNKTEIWEKHLHWPHHDAKAKKRKYVKEKMPLAITSPEWVNYYEQQENLKKEKEEQIKLRKLKREDKKNNIETTKKRVEKRKHGGKDNCYSKSKVEVTENVVANDITKNEVLHEDHSETPETLDIGDYVIVEYDNKKYPGLIKAINDQDFEISVMEETINKKWKWPKPADQIWYHRNQIIKRVTEPKPFNSRGLYVIDVINDNN